MLSYICYFLTSLFADVAYPSNPPAGLTPLILIFFAVIIFVFIQLVIGGIIALVIILNRKKQ